jgi:hypothetical protein
MGLVRLPQIIPHKFRRIECAAQFSITAPHERLSEAIACIRGQRRALEALALAHHIIILNGVCLVREPESFKRAGRLVVSPYAVVQMRPKPLWR